MGEQNAFEAAQSARDEKRAEIERLTAQAKEPYTDIKTYWWMQARIHQLQRELSVSDIDVLLAAHAADTQRIAGLEIEIGETRQRVAVFEARAREYNTRLKQIAALEYEYALGETVGGERDRYQELFEFAKWQAQTALGNAIVLAALATSDTAGESTVPPGSYKVARGAFNWDGEPAEKTVRRMRDGEEGEADDDQSWALFYVASDTPINDQSYTRNEALRRAGELAESENRPIEVYEVNYGDVVTVHPQTDTGNTDD